MDQISVQSSESQNSSCSVMTYEGTDGYISDGEDPFFIAPPEQQSDHQLEEVMDQSQSELDDSSKSSRSKSEVNYQQKRFIREKKKRQKEIMDELKYGRNTTQLLNRNPLIPTHDEVIRVLQEIKKKYPKSKLHYQLIDKKKEEERRQLLSQTNPEAMPKKLTPEEKESKSKWLQQRKIAAMSFCELGYGITKMRKYIEQHALNIQIDIHTYDEIIKKLMFDAYHRLERFLRKKCHKKLRPTKNDVEQKFLLDILKNCKNKLDPFEMHIFYKMIKMTFIDDEQFKISKRIASRLYHTCQEYISRKKIKVGLLNIDNPECEIYNDDKTKWTDKMIETAIDLYVKQASLNRVKEIMTKMYNIDQKLLDNRHIKYHIQNKIKIAIQRIEGYIEKGKYQVGNALKLKDMQPVDEFKMKWLLNSVQATNVRVILCEIYKSEQPSLALLNQAILFINQFLIKKENQEMIQERRRIEKEYNPHQNQFKRRRRSKRR